MSDETRSWIDRVLGYEDLEPEARAEVDAMLARSPRLRALLEELRSREAAAVPRGSLPPESAWEALALDDAGADAERASLRALLERAGARTGPTAAALPPVTLPPPRARRRVPVVAWLVPAAAAAAALLLWPRAPRVPAPPAPPVSAPSRPAAAALTALAIERATATRGSGTSPWRSGDPFRLRLELASPGAPVVFVLGADGALARLHPPAGGRPESVAAGELLLPAPGSDVRWAFEGRAGTETFFAGLAPESLEVEAVTAAIRSAVEGVAGRSARAAVLDSALRRSLRDVRRLEIAHR